MNEQVEIFSSSSLFNLEEEINYFLETAEDKFVSLQVLIDPSRLPSRYIVMLVYEASNNE